MPKLYIVTDRLASYRPTFRLPRLKTFHLARNTFAPRSKETAYHLPFGRTPLRSSSSNRRSANSIKKSLTVLPS